MSRTHSAGVRTRLHETASRVPNPLPEWASWPLKFYICGAIGAALWGTVLFVLIETGSSDVFSSSAESSSSTASSGSDFGSTEIILVMAVTLPAVAAGAVYRKLPDNTVDVFHRFGKGAALFFTVNVLLSAGFIASVLAGDSQNLASLLESPINIIALWSLASMFLPGTYLGVLVATRWAQ